MRLPLRSARIVFEESDRHGYFSKENVIVVVICLRRPESLLGLAKANLWGSKGDSTLLFQCDGAAVQRLAATERA